MKTKSLVPATTALIVTALCLLTPSAFSIPFTETFNNYPLGNLAGNTNIETNAWAPCGTLALASGTNDMYVTNITLTYPGLSCPGTNSLYYGNLGVTERVGLGPITIVTNASNVVTTNVYVQSGGTIYYSYVFVVTNLANMTTVGGFVCGFNNLTGTQTNQPTTVGARLYMRLSSVNTSSGYEIGIGKSPASPSSATWATNEFVLGQTNFIVASYTFVAAGTSNDIAQLWINPDPTNFGVAIPPNPDGTNIIGNDIQTGGNNSIESFLFRQGNTVIPIIVAADLRVGTNWSDVTPPIVTNAPPPTPVPLSVTVSAGNALLAWSTNSSGFRLQGTPTLIVGSNAWTNVAAPTNIVGTNFSVSDPITGKNYYRLIYP